VLARRARTLILGGRARAQRHQAPRADSPANFLASSAMVAETATCGRAQSGTQ
jgi:hypothetical protein